MPCACDACDRPVEPLDARGYCAFCARRCAPVVSMDDRPVLVTISREARLAAHANPAARVAALRQHLAEEAVAIATPVLRQAGEALLDAIRQKIAGPRR